MPDEIAIPEGFKRLPIKSGFINQVGEFYETWRDGRRIIAIRVEEKHLNSAGATHGGFLLTVADFALSWGSHEAGDVPPRRTLSLTMEFAAPARAGAWLEADVDVLRAGKRIAFLTCFLYADGERIGRASGVFQLAARRDNAVVKQSEIS